LAATTALSDNCGATGLTKTVQTGAGSCDTTIVIRVADSCGNHTDYTYNTRVDNTPPTATQGTINSCYADAITAEAAAMAATTGLSDDCGAAGVTKFVMGHAGTCDTTIVIRVADSCGNHTDYTYHTRVDNTPPTATQGTINSCYADAITAEAAAMAATTGLSDDCGPAGVTKFVVGHAGTCDT